MFESYFGSNSFLRTILICRRNIAVERCVDDVDFTVREEDATSFELVATPRIDVAASSSRGRGSLIMENTSTVAPASFCRWKCAPAGSSRCEGERRYRTLISLLGSLATMRLVVNYHSSWARQQQVELFDASGNPGFTAGRGFNPAGGAPGGGVLTVPVLQFFLILPLRPVSGIRMRQQVYPS
ncbi:hypothetical protein F511_41749 [Dorcoceras hygrometricum]|uniref:Uncharacterized protein n=1 Tax=Dorcoceras hygrometricum TaxID=472368 RepID=A0A2Z7CQ43_9LAMI|nr:hypothetical protein F511_41749 [Dorcoceras hygrometricum]